MKDVDKYYNRYSSTVQFAGSHYDRLRIKKPDEFDMDVVIGLPLSIRHNPFNIDDSDFIIEPKDAGYVHLKMGKQFKNLPMRDSLDWDINKTAFKWKDENDYLLRSKFTDWFKGVVVRALNTFDRNVFSQPIYVVNGVVYTIDRSESGPAITIKIKNRNFQMDVDLVPALKFPEDRWPVGPDYRNIPHNCKKDYWMVVPKPNKNGQCDVSKSRSWRIAMHYQERELMYNTNHLRQSIRLLKKLRDSQGMEKIASYYIKTLAFWEIERINDISYWNKNPAELFKLMVKIFHKAMVDGNIPYYWNRHNNLIEGINRQLLISYAARLKNLMDVLEVPSQYKKVARFLLTQAEFEDYNKRFLKD
ncbi:unnamed protein product [Diatraea saccharalis]|uniref:Uncharacterized protein n=1 Tax=Diatraea saccharalis TaxID=40085 RepID=A0A9P0C3Y2_9NEOP|nr:unnamed protein product [Diatraea saccharalis]